MSKFVFYFLYQRIFANICKVLSKEVVVRLDELSNSVSQFETVKNYPYKSMDEILHLNMVSLLRELLHDCTGNFEVRSF